MKFDLTITLGDILVALGFCGTLIGAAWAVIRKLNEFVQMFRYYPPHRHHGDTEIEYPPGYEPGKVEEIGKKVTA